MEPGPSRVERRESQQESARRRRRLAFAIGAALLTNVRLAAWPLETLFVVAVAAVVFANRCAAATLYHVLRRRLSPEDKTMPTSAATGRC